MVKDSPMKALWCGLSTEGGGRATVTLLRRAIQPTPTDLHRTQGHGRSGDVWRVYHTLGRSSPRSQLDSGRQRGRDSRDRSMVAAVRAPRFQTTRERRPG
jgi:hypothetical protein